MDAVIAQSGGGLGADTYQRPHGQRGEKLRFLSLGYHHQAVRLLEIGGDLGDALAGSQAHGDGQPDLAADAILDVDGDGNGGGLLRRLGDVQVGFVQRYRLDDGRNFPEYVHDERGHLAVAVKAGPDDDALGTLAHRRGHGHGGMNAEPAGLVGRGGDDPAALGPAADQHRLAAQFGVVELLHGGVESVQIGVDDVADHVGSVD